MLGHRLLRRHPGAHGPQRRLAGQGPHLAVALSIRKALGAVKDQATIGITQETGAVVPDLDVAIVHATSHDDATPDDRHAREVLRLASATGAAPA